MWTVYGIRKIRRIGFHLPRIEEILHDFNPDKVIRDINDILELYEIAKFVD